MKIKECAYISNETLIGTSSNGTCNLFPKIYDQVGNYRFVDCETIPISKCPYKEFKLGIIDKLELNNKIKKILDKGD